MQTKKFTVDKSKAALLIEDYITFGWDVTYKKETGDIVEITFMREEKHYPKQLLRYERDYRHCKRRFPIGTIFFGLISIALWYGKTLSGFAQYEGLIFGGAIFFTALTGFLLFGFLFMTLGKKGIRKKIFKKARKILPHPEDLFGDAIETNPNVATPTPENRLEVKPTPAPVINPTPVVAKEEVKNPNLPDDPIDGQKFEDEPNK